MDNITIQQTDAQPVMKIVKPAMALIVQIAFPVNKLLNHYTININAFLLVQTVLIRFLRYLQEHAKLAMIQIVKFVLMVVIHHVLSVWKVNYS